MAGNADDHWGAVAVRVDTEQAGAVGQPLQLRRFHADFGGKFPAVGIQFLPVIFTAVLVMIKLRSSRLMFWPMLCCTMVR